MTHIDPKPPGQAMTYDPTPPPDPATTPDADYPHLTEEEVQAARRAYYHCSETHYERKARDHAEIDRIYAKEEAALQDEASFIHWWCIGRRYNRRLSQETLDRFRRHG